ncbi:hypothetical protein FRB98_001273 [Tulasnella sp. 332]|nr:hypothetical protein FRB98_001273 [Tulasnella sp. 332]
MANHNTKRSPQSKSKATTDAPNLVKVDPPVTTVKKQTSHSASPKAGEIAKGGSIKEPTDSVTQLDVVGSVATSTNEVPANEFEGRGFANPFTCFTHMDHRNTGQTHIFSQDQFAGAFNDLANVAKKLMKGVFEYLENLIVPGRKTLPTYSLDAVKSEEGR